MNKKLTLGLILVAYLIVPRPAIAEVTLPGLERLLSSQGIAYQETITWGYPVNGPISSPFGPRGEELHHGIDFAVPIGTPVRASRAGVVVFSGYRDVVGNVVQVDHLGDTQTLYAHNSQLLTTVGDRVDVEDVIALSGNTGRSTGPHVHFEIRINGGTRSVNPMIYLPSM